LEISHPGLESLLGTLSMAIDAVKAVSNPVLFKIDLTDYTLYQTQHIMHLLVNTFKHASHSISLSIGEWYHLMVTH